MAGRKIPGHFPDALSVFGSKCRTIRVPDYFKDLTDNLKSVAYHRRFEVISVEHYFPGGKLRQWRLCGKRLVAINRYSGQQIGRALRVELKIVIASNNQNRVLSCYTLLQTHRLVAKSNYSNASDLGSCTVLLASARLTICGAAESPVGTSRTCRTGRCMSVIGGEAEVGLRVRQVS